MGQGHETTGNKEGTTLYPAPRASLDAYDQCDKSMRPEHIQLQPSAVGIAPTSGYERKMVHNMVLPI